MSTSSKHLSLNDRISILQFVNENKSMRKIGEILGYSSSTISRELFLHAISSVLLYLLLHLFECFIYFDIQAFPNIYC